jgi:hypothetical protein
MRLFLDSSAIIELFRNNPDVVAAIKDADEVYTSSLCAYEVLAGEKYAEAKGMKSHYKDAANFFETVATMPFDYSDAKRTADIMSVLSAKGRKVPEIDALIAAQAIAAGLTILTKDAKHFAVIGAETGLAVQTV